MSDPMTEALGIREMLRVIGQEDLGGGRILRYLTQPYAGHPDYDESWRPFGGTE